MYKLLTVLTLLLFLIWAVGFFIYNFDNTVHLFLALATLTFTVTVIKEK